jgi:hypothetical protein
MDFFFAAETSRSQKFTPQYDVYAKNYAMQNGDSDFGTLSFLEPRSYQNAKKSADLAREYFQAFYNSTNMNAINQSFLTQYPFLLHQEKRSKLHIFVRRRLPTDHYEANNRLSIATIHHKTCI